MTRKTGIMMLKIQLCIKEINEILKSITIKITIEQFCKCNFELYYFTIVFTVFLSIYSISQK